MGAEPDEDGADAAVKPRGEIPDGPTLNASVRKRRADRAFYIRLAAAIRQNERALERLKQ